MRDKLHTEIAVIGSGPGGAVTGCLLAEAGHDVTLIEYEYGLGSAIFAQYAAPVLKTKVVD